MQEGRFWLQFRTYTRAVSWPRVPVAFAAGLVVGALLAVAVTHQWHSVQPNGSGASPSSSGLKSTDLKVGSGAAVTNGQAVTIRYTIWLADGTWVDSSDDRKQPFTFNTGAGAVIKGLDQGVMGMRVGGIRWLTIPPGLAYGATEERPPTGGPGIPPNSTLLMLVNLISTAAGPTAAPTT
jgi:FKBP-type peptidyl-prolyl cis-trans isomerase FkpA